MHIHQTVEKYILKDIRERIDMKMPSCISFSICEYKNLFEESDLSFLFASELGCLNPRAQIKRKKEFFLGRLAATDAALRICDKSDRIEVVRGDNAMPQWYVNSVPDVLVGSISHQDMYAVSAVAKSSECLAIGVDIVSTERETTNRLFLRLCSEEEQFRLKSSWNGSENTLRVLVFSAKESLYKLFSSLSYTRLEWHDLSLEEIRKNSQCYTLTMKVSDSLRKKTERRDFSMPDVIRFSGFEFEKMIVTSVCALRDINIVNVV